MREFFHPILLGVVKYSDEQAAWLDDKGEVEFQRGNFLYRLRKIPDKDVLYVHSVGHAPLPDHADDMPELEADEPEGLDIWADDADDLYDA